MSLSESTCITKSAANDATALQVNTSVSTEDLNLPYNTAWDGNQPDMNVACYEEVESDDSAYDSGSDFMSLSSMSSQISMDSVNLDFKRHESMSDNEAGTGNVEDSMDADPMSNSQLAGFGFVHPRSDFSLKDRDSDAGYALSSGRAASLTADPIAQGNLPNNNSDTVISSSAAQDEVLPSNGAALSPTSQEKKARVERIMALMAHSLNCGTGPYHGHGEQSSPSSPSTLTQSPSQCNLAIVCSKMKRVIAHAQACRDSIRKARASGTAPPHKSQWNCPICKQILAICVMHARECPALDGACKAPYCGAIKEKIRTKQRAVEARERRAHARDVAKLLALLARNMKQRSALFNPSRSL